jgi:hypothetical protein
MQISSDLYSRRRGRRSQQGQDRGKGQRSGERRETPPPVRSERSDDDGPELPSNVTTLVLRAIVLDGAVYNVIRNHAGANMSALGVVVAVALLIATGLRNVESIFLEGAHPALWFILRVNIVVLGWLLWWAIVAIFGLWVFKGRATRSQLLRALGIASAPAALVAFSEINVDLMNQTVGEAMVLFGVLWTLVTGTQAIKETLNIPWYPAAILGLVGWAIAWVLFLSALMWSPSAEAIAPSPSDSGTATSTSQGL